MSADFNEKRKGQFTALSFFGASVHNETIQNTLLYGIQNIF